MFYGFSDVVNLFGSSPDISSTSPVKQVLVPQKKLIAMQIIIQHYHICVSEEKIKTLFSATYYPLFLQEAS